MAHCPGEQRGQHGQHPTTGDGAGWDFFVSYTQTDQPWAEWIAWTLEEAGYCASE
ncbi:toll/interleukin-1 receptor domain-containing protein [Parafrankia colletiae]|uniref:toll/interleukin-1 receptor domain-containing protein n=1 Tax=Parafrankia colletiae TaxID=573497 RepID=UPI000AA27616